MKVLVIGKNGLGLMPTTPRKARTLLKENHAEITCRHPFTIRLLYKTGCNTQPATLGVDTGSQHIGIAVVSEGTRVIEKAEYALRTTMSKRALLETRKEYRRGRRYRKTRYRKPKFGHKTIRRYSGKPVKRNGHMTHWIKETTGFTTDRPEGWLPPSMQSKCDMHIQIIGRYRSALPKNTKIRLEVGRFDIARIKDPTVHNELYQQGPMCGYENVKAYVFDRDHYKCRVCSAKAGSKRKDGTTVKLLAHHIDFRSKAATDNPDRMASVCDHCHTGKTHQPGGILYDWMVKGKKFRRGYRDMTFMNILRKRLRKAFPDAEFTYGNITQADRKSLKLEKTHANDAIAIATGKSETGTIRDMETTYHQQVRKKKRSLHEANPRKGIKEPNRMAKRNRKNTKAITVKGKELRLFDRVSLLGRTGWITGFTGSSVRVVDKNNKYIQHSDKYTQVPGTMVKVMSRNNNWLTGAMEPLGNE